MTTDREGLLSDVRRLMSMPTPADTDSSSNHGVGIVPTIARRDPATGRFISAEAFARLSSVFAPEVTGKPAADKKKADGKKNGKYKSKAPKNKKRSAASGGKKSAKKGKKKR